MSQINFNTKKEKKKHLTSEQIEYIINSVVAYNESVRLAFRATNKNHHSKVPKRNTGKTAFINNLTKEVNCSRATIYNILKASKITILDSQLNEKETYSALTVIYKRKDKKPKNNSKLLKAKQFIDLVVKEVKSHTLTSIDEAVNDLKLNRADEIKGLETVCTTSIYNYIHANLIDLKPLDLPRMVRRKIKKNWKEYTSRASRGTSIEKRPSEVDDRKIPGHWEGDLVCGPRDGANGAFLTLIERTTRFYYMIPIKDKRADSVNKAIIKLSKLFKGNFNKVFKTITFDNGVEFSKYEELEKKLKIKCFFAHPYSSYERGSNEKCNQLIRYYIKKGTPINSLPRKYIRQIQIEINQKKRKILGYESAESFFTKTFDLTNNMPKLYL